MARPALILFDLDGTLTDPKPGITGSIQYALERMGEPVPHADELEWTIGPPLRLNFVRLVGEARADEGVRLYRERFGETGLFENRLIDGIPELLNSLHTQGHQLVVATSKPHVFASRIVEHFGLAPYFTTVYGSELDGTRVDKRDLLRHIRDIEQLHPHRSVMIGDREHDVHGAKAIDVRTIGVRWGYGSDEELHRAGAYALVDSPHEIAEHVSVLLS
jgi:phosphoglycolate phosphatase